MRIAVRSLIDYAAFFAVGWLVGTTYGWWWAAAAVLLAGMYSCFVFVDGLKRRTD